MRTCPRPFQRLAVVLIVSVAPATAASAQALDSKPFAKLTNPGLGIADSVVALARAQLGRKYRTGGQSPDRGFDCSGLVRYIMAALNQRLPRTSGQQATVGEGLPRDITKLRPGDLLTFSPSATGRVSHVGIYIGGGRYVHASSVAGRVIESRIDGRAAPLVRVWQGARRLLVVSDSVPAKSGGD